VENAVLRLLRVALATICIFTITPVPAPAATEALPQVTLGWSPGFDSPQILIANTMSLWRPAGVDVKFTTFASGRAALEALLGGQVDFVIAAELPAVTAAMRGQPFKVIADLSRYHGNRIIATSALSSVKELAGKRLGTTVGTSTEFILDNELKRAGIKPEVVNADPSDLVPALAHGDIDAASMFSNLNPEAEAVLGNRYHELRIPEVTHLLVIATQEVVTRRPAVVRDVIAAMIAADAIIKAKPVLAREKLSGATSGEMSVDQLRLVWPEYEFETRLDQPLVDLMMLEGQWLLDTGMIKNVAISKAFFRGYIDDDPLRAVAANRVSLH
jgi:NitT/TauT family transport system substrate-binding protein